MNFIRLGLPAVVGLKPNSHQQTCTVLKAHGLGPPISVAFNAYSMNSTFLKPTI